MNMYIIVMVLQYLCGKIAISKLITSLVQDVEVYGLPMVYIWNVSFPHCMFRVEVRLHVFRFTGTETCIRNQCIYILV